MNPPDDNLSADIRRAIPLCEEPFDARAVLDKLSVRDGTTVRTVQNVLHKFANRGELARSLVKRGRRKNAAVFETTVQFGEIRSSADEIGAAMQRLDAVVRAWKRNSPKEIRT